MLHWMIMKLGLIDLITVITSIVQLRDQEVFLPAIMQDGVTLCEEQLILCLFFPKLGDGRPSHEHCEVNLCDPARRRGPSGEPGERFVVPDSQ